MTIAPSSQPMLNSSGCEEFLLRQELADHVAAHKGREARQVPRADTDPPKVPCDACGMMVPFETFADHAAAHRFQSDEVSASSSRPPDLLPCEWCGELLLRQEFADHVAAHKEREANEASFDNFCTPDVLAARLVEDLRSIAEPRGTDGQPVLPLGSVANFDLAVDFIAYARKLRQSRGEVESKLEIVYHWTPKENFQKIIDGNLRVPDGKQVLTKTDQGFYGAGIYTSPDFNYGRAYAYGTGACFLCIAMPGRRYLASYPQNLGKPCHPGFDCHVSADGHQLEWVFFSSCQLLPCFLVEDATHTLALATANKCLSWLSRDLGEGARHPMSS